MNWTRLFYGMRLRVLKVVKVINGDFNSITPESAVRLTLFWKVVF